MPDLGNSLKQFLVRGRVRLRDVAVANGFFVTGDEWCISVASLSSLDDIPALMDASPTVTAADVFGVSARFVADPFLFERHGTVYLFMEVMDAVSNKGLIGWAELDDNGWRFAGVALEERFHLSYPQILESEGEVYMIPETSDEQSVRLYRASTFPSKWEYWSTLLEGETYSDASLFKHDGLWWMLVESSSGPSFDTLRLFLSSHLEGPWSEHPCSPIVKGDAKAARPAGPPVWLDGMLIRLAQDCREVYGRAVFGFEVVRLSPALYEERGFGDAPLLCGRGSGWNGQGMHHVSVLPQGDHWLVAVDGRPMPGFRLPKPQHRGRSTGRGASSN